MTGESLRERLDRIERDELALPWAGRSGDVLWLAAQLREAWRVLDQNGLLESRRFPLGRAT